MYYRDETWVFKNMCCTKLWEDIVSSSTQDAYNIPSGKGTGSIISHVGCTEIGLLNNCLLMFGGSNSYKFSDYSTDMN